MEKQKKYFWILLDVFVVVLIAGAVVVGLPTLLSLRDSYQPARTMTVSAEGQTIAAPDLAEISFSVLTQGANPETLATDNTSKMNAVLEFVGSEGISASDTATTDYDLEPNYQYDQNTQRQYITGYSLTQTVTVKIHDLTKVASVLGGLAPLGVNEIGGVNFTFNDPEAALAPARADGFAKAEAKAVEMASEAGVSLGAILNVSESGTTPPPHPIYAMASGAAGPTVSTPPTIEPGTQNLTDDVTITYALQ